MCKCNKELTMEMINIGDVMPAYATEGASGIDLSAFIDETVVIMPMSSVLIGTGTYVSIPKGYEGQVRMRSGVSAKNSIILLNGVGTIDSDYRGEIKLALFNLHDKPFIINNGDRLAQLVVAKYERVQIVTVDELCKTDRGDGGFGSTGK